MPFATWTTCGHQIYLHFQSQICFWFNRMENFYIFYKRDQFQMSSNDFAAPTCFSAGKTESVFELNAALSMKCNRSYDFVIRRELRKSCLGEMTDARANTHFILSKNSQFNILNCPSVQMHATERVQHDQSRTLSRSHHVDFASEVEVSIVNLSSLQLKCVTCIQFSHIIHHIASDENRFEAAHFLDWNFLIYLESAGTCFRAFLFESIPFTTMCSD